MLGGWGAVAMGLLNYYYTNLGWGYGVRKGLGRFYRVVERVLLYNFIMLSLPVKDTSRPLRPSIRKTIQFSLNDITIPVATLKFKILLKNVAEVRYRFVGVIPRTETGPIRVVSITYHYLPFFSFLTISQIVYDY